ncbi:uncharacterized protein N7496_008187 [Penicillium cataractarum]|uniref:Uncharacterized protein n=1 Tax=Penicillium cataractarum TaxID=2100454 RepID=A0A9W9V4I6_9EURO|nr:uncharacterized protein N7496_008187 [Penicillium cataractarum]KAJ5368427.1 hypothetical protein N7496_008187 [Penicillium cataractarum]
MPEQLPSRPANGQDVNPPSDVEAPDASYQLRDTNLAAYEEMIQRLRELRDQYEVSEKLLGMLRKAQFQREQTLKQIDKGITTMERFSKEIERMVKEEIERRSNAHEGLREWIEAIDRIQGKKDSDESSAEAEE